ncbi:MAG: prepilin-type N-terminal cleavage/methylation domain-containing protein [Eubacterium sp.]|nr:prepilin-type N-terminal cleavage/methylation domain-containing protein [Eubacterium sp.]
MNSVKSNKGFTFVELIISMAILSLIAVAIVGVMSSNTVIFRKTKTDLEVQNVAMDSMTMLENDLMQAKYIEIESDDPDAKYICSSDLNILKYAETNSIHDNESLIDTLISQSESQTKNIYKAFKNDTSPSSNPKYDTVGDEKRAIYDSFYYKVRYMTKQDKQVYKLFLDSIDYAHNKTKLSTFDSLTSTTELKDIKKITIVYPNNLPAPSSESVSYVAKPDPTATLEPSATPLPTIDPLASPTPIPSPKIVTETVNVDYECCIVKYEVVDDKLNVSRTYSSTTGKNVIANTYTDYIDGKLSGYVNSEGNSLSLKVKFRKNNRQYDSNKSIVIRNSNVLNDAK